MIISIIAAMSENRVIGSGGNLPWKIPADLARFKSLTMGHVVVMGRKTFESIGHPLPGRTNIVLSRTKSSINGCLVAASLPDAIVAADGEEEFFVLGGAGVFAEALPLAHRIYLTIVHQHYEGDTFFPELPETFVEIRREPLPKAAPECSFTVLEKVEPVLAGADAEELCRKGHAALKRELYYLARSCFQHAAELQDSPEVSSFLALSLVNSSGDFATGLELARRALERDPQNPVLYLNLGRIQILAGLKDDAVNTFRLGVQAGGGAEFLEELNTHAARPSPPLPSFSRSHPLNKYIGLVLNRLRMR